MLGVKSNNKERPFPQVNSLYYLTKDSVITKDRNQYLKGRQDDSTFQEVIVALASRQFQKNSYQVITI